MNSQLIIPACGVFAAILALALAFYTKHKDISHKKIKIIFILLLFIDFIVFAYALSSTEAVNSTPMVVSLMPDKTNPSEAGTTIKWTAAALDPDKDLVQYKFLLDGQQRTNWSYDSSWYWSTSNADIGSHTIEVTVKDGNHIADGDDFKDIDFTISPQQNRSPTPAADAINPVATPNQPPSIDGLTPVPNGPQPAGTTIVWITDATDPDSDQIFYEYLLNGKSETNWGSDNAWTWKTSAENTGKNQIEVRVQDGKHASPDKYDANKMTSFIINAPQLVPQTSANQSNLIQRNPMEDEAENWNTKGTVLTRNNGNDLEPLGRTTEAKELQEGDMRGTIVPPVMNELNATINETFYNVTTNEPAHEGIVTLTILVSHMYYIDTGIGTYNIKNATVEGRDGSGNSFRQTTDFSGSVTIKGDPGTWSLTVSADGFNTESVYWDLTDIKQERTIYLFYLSDPVDELLFADTQFVIGVDDLGNKLYLLDNGEVVSLIELKERINELEDGDTIRLNLLLDAYPDCYSIGMDSKGYEVIEISGGKKFAYIKENMAAYYDGTLLGER